MTPLDRSHTPPPESKDTIAGLATPTLDVEVVMRKLENAPEGLQISFKSSRQAF
jgi:hypothetical protein